MDWNTCRKPTSKYLFVYLYPLKILFCFLAGLGFQWTQWNTWLVPMPPSSSLIHTKHLQKMLLQELLRGELTVSSPSSLMTTKMNISSGNGILKLKRIGINSKFTFYYLYQRLRPNYDKTLLYQQLWLFFDLTGIFCIHNSMQCYFYTFVKDNKKGPYFFTHCCSHSCRSESSPVSHSRLQMLIVAKCIKMCFAFLLPRPPVLWTISTLCFVPKFLVAQIISISAAPNFSVYCKGDLLRVIKYFAIVQDNNIHPELIH